MEKDRKELLEKFMFVVNYLVNHGEMMKAYMMLRNIPSFVEGDKKIAELNGRLSILKNLHNHGSADGRINATFIDPESVDDIIKYKLVKEEILKLGLKKVVDVGCYTGWLGRGLSLSGIAVHGIDVHPVVIQLAAFAASGSLATFEYLPVEKLGIAHPKEYEAAILFDVLEHTFDPENVMKSVHNSLVDGGWVFINLPSPEEEHKADSHPLDKHEHLYSFSKTKLDKMFGGKKNYELKTISNEEGTTNWFIKYQNG